MSTELGEMIAFVVIGGVLVASGLASSLVRRTFHSVMFLGVFLVAVAGLYVLLGSPLLGVIQVLVYVGGILTLFVFAVMFVAGSDDEKPKETVLGRSRAWSTLAAIAVTLAILFIAVQFTMPANRAAGGLFGGSYTENADGTQTWVATTASAWAGFIAGSLFVVALAIAGILAWLGIRHAIDTWPGMRIFGTLLAGTLLGLLMGVVAVGTSAWGPPGTGAVAAANDLTAVVDGLFTTHVVALEILGVLLTAVMIGALVTARPLGAVADEKNYVAPTPQQVAESQAASRVPDDIDTSPGAPPSTPAASPPGGGA